MIRTITFSTLLLTMSFLFGCAAMQQSDAASAPADASAEQTAAQPASVDFRLAQGESDENLSKLELPNDAGTVWYIPQPILTRENINNAEPRRTKDDQAFVRFTFSADGAKQLADVSQRFPGKLLVLTIDGTLIRILRIDQPITNGILDVPFDSEKQAIGLVNIIAGRAQLK